MKFFIDLHRASGLMGDGPIRAKFTNKYIQVEVPAPEYPHGDLFLTSYLIIRDANSVYVSACLGNKFDGFFDDYSKSTIKNTWPTLYELAINGIDKKFSKGALNKLEDNDTGELKWFALSVVGNLDLNNENLLINPRINQAMNLVLFKSVKMLLEMESDRPAFARRLFDGISSGLIKGMRFWKKYKDFEGDSSF